MQRLARSGLLILLLASLASAQPVLQIADLGGGVFDLNLTDLDQGTVWTTAGVAGETENGAKFAYAYDANNAQQLTGLPSSTLTTNFRGPCNQLHCDRNPSRNAVAFAGRYIAGQGDPIASATQVDVAYFDPPGGNSFGTGSIGRIALELDGTGFAPGDVFATSGTPPPGTTVLARGVATATTDAWFDFAAVEISWSIYAVPEPGTLALLGLVTAACLPGLRRRRGA